MNDPQITDLVIVGGGSAGWLTAGIIAAEHLKTEQSSSRVKVTLVEAPNINTIGVGEGTWPSMRSTLKRIGISETDFIRDCDVSLKQGTLFSGWTDGKDIYTHPFTVPHAYSQHNLSRDWQNKLSDLPFA